MFLLFFSFSLLLANIYCFIKKKYLYIFVPCMIFLPPYYGIEISASLPIITVSRLMYVIFYIYIVLNQKRHITFPLFQSTKLKPSPCFFFLGFYFFLRIVSNIAHIVTHIDSAKTIFHIIFEELFLIVAIYLLSPSKSELISTIKVVLWVATVLFVIGIFESFTFIRPFDSLYTVSRFLLNDHYIRLGMLRATTTMGIPNYFGNICLLILPIALFFYQQYKLKRYLLIVFLDYYAMIHSGCRSIMFFSFFVLILFFIIFCRTKSERIVFMKNFFLIAFLITIIATLLSVGNERYRYYYTGTVKSLLNEIGFNFDLSANAPDGIEGYGQNELSGSQSRFEQLSGISYTINKSPLFGFGTGAQKRNEVMYYALGKWVYADKYDIALFEIVANEGIVGLIGYIMLFVAMIYELLLLRNNEKKYYSILIIEIIAYLFTTLCTINMSPILMIIVIAVLNNELLLYDKNN